MRGNALDVVAAWKEVLLALALGYVVWRQRGLPFKATATDWLALAFAGLVCLYALIPQGWLGGEASARGIVFGARHALTPVAAYFLGRSLYFDRAELRRIAAVVLATAAAVAAWGLIDIYAVSLQFWRDSGVPGWFEEQLGLDYRGLSGLPENFVYNPGDERPLRRLVSTFLSPLATAYMLLVAILVATTWQRARWFSALSGLAARRPPLHLLADDDRRARLRAGRARLRAAELVAGGCGRRARRRVVLLHPRLSGHRAGDELHAGGARDPEGRWAGGGDERRSVQPGRVLDRQPLGQPARRHRDRPAAPARLRPRQRRRHREADRRRHQGGRVDLHGAGGRAGAASACSSSSPGTSSLLRTLLPRAPWLAAALAAVLVLGIQTDVIGVHWLAFVLWTLAGERA